MGFLAIFMTGIGLSMDAVAVSIAKGMTLKEKLLENAIKIAVFFGVFQGLMPLIGWWAGRYFEEYIKSFDHWIAFILLGAIGGKMIYESIKGVKERKESENENKRQIEMEVSSDTISIENEELKNKDLIVLAVATSIDALAIGVSFAFLNVSIIPSIIIIALTTFVLCIVAVIIGKKLGTVLQKYAELVGGIILILIGFNILIEHLISK